MRQMRLPTLLATTSLVLLLAACGAAQTSTAPTGAVGDAAAAPTADSMAGMDHSNMPGMSSTTAPATDSGMVAPTAEGGMAGMDHGVVSAEGQPYDAAFIDSMIVHHEGAIIMASQALEQAERPEITELANAIISAQEAEIAQMKEWRTTWFPDLPETTGMEMDMGPMEVPEGDAPFDQRFIQAMIPHHEGAIAMAQEALQNAERQEIKDLAQAIISAQEAEIAQMKEWLSAWYGIEQ
jgi:uncharacterized protein (DUF305 family)